MFRRWHHLYLVLLLSWCTRLSGAVPTDLSQLLAALPQDTKWVVVWDTDRFGRSRIGQMMLKQWMAKEPDRKEDQILRELGLQIHWRTISRIVLFGQNYLAPEPERGLALLWMESDLTPALTNAIRKQSRKIIQVVEVTPRPIYAIGTNLLLAVARPGLIVTGTSLRLLRNELELLCAEPKQPPESALTQLLTGFSGKILYGAAIGLNQIPVAPARKINALSFAAEEAGDRVILTAEAECVSSEDAAQLYDIILGFRSLALFLELEQQWVQEFSRSINVVRRDMNITVQASLPVDTVLGLLSREMGRD